MNLIAKFIFFICLTVLFVSTMQTVFYLSLSMIIQGVVIKLYYVLWPLVSLFYSFLTGWIISIGKTRVKSLPKKAD